MPVAGLGLSTETRDHRQLQLPSQGHLDFCTGSKIRIHGFNLSFFKSYVGSECWPRYFKVTDTKYYFLKMNSHFLDKMMELTVRKHTCT